MLTLTIILGIVLVATAVGLGVFKVKLDEHIKLKRQAQLWQTTVKHVKWANKEAERLGIPATYIPWESE